MFYVRKGDGPETMAELQAQAEKAARNTYPFGVTIWQADEAPDHEGDRSALVDAVHATFPDTVQSGSNLRHFTLVLPNPVDAQAAARFNALFKAKE